MKVLHIAQKVKGGVATYLCQLIPAQVDRLGEHHVLLAVGSDELLYFDEIAQSTLRPFASSRRSLRSFAATAVAIHRLIAAERPDIVHVHSSFAGVLVRARYLLTPRFRRPALVYCAHGWSFNMRVPAWQKRLYVAVERLMARVTDVIICISQFERDRAIHHGLPADKLVMIYNGLPSTAEPDDRPPVTFTGDVLNLLFIGRDTPQKGLDDLLAAMELIENRSIHLHIVGDSSKQAIDGPPTRTRSNVTQHGWHDHRRIAAFIDAADVLVMPSRWEGFGLAAIEAMRQRKPICASNVDALPELVRPGISGYLFEPGDVPALAALLTSLDRATLARLGAGGRRLFLDTFSADEMIANVMKVYSAL